MYHNNQIWHWGVKGMKWGVRRYQNEDGTLNAAGKKRYASDVVANAKKKKDNRLPEDGLNDPNRWVKEDRERTKRVVDCQQSDGWQSENTERQVYVDSSAQNPQDGLEQND